MRDGLIIDAVITWVDGNDPAHRAKRIAAMAEAGLSGRSNATYETRFLDNGEIYYCIASILKYAPFIRHIYVVTDNQKPTKIDDFVLEGICDKDRIRIVDHKEILAGYDEAMPTFNSLTLESVLWRIEGCRTYSCIATTTSSSTRRSRRIPSSIPTGA